MGLKVIIRFWWVSGLLSASRNQLTTFCRPFAHYACWGLRSVIICSIQNNFLYFVCYGWSAQTSPKHWFEKHECDVNYDVTNNRHKIQMTPCATEWPPHQNFLHTPLVAAHRRWLSKDVIDTVSWLSQSTDIFTKFNCNCRGMALTSLKPNQQYSPSCPSLILFKRSRALHEL